MTAHDPRLLAWAYLSRVVQGPSAYMSMLIDELGVDETARAVRDGDLPPAIGEKTPSPRSHRHSPTRPRPDGGDGWQTRNTELHRLAGVANAFL